MDNESRDIRPKVEKNPLHPFVTPEGYFEGFKANIMERIREEEQVTDAPRIDMDVLKRNRLWVYLSAAAAVIAVALLINFGSIGTNSGKADELLATQVELSEDEFEQFLIDDTADDYWREILLESDGDEDMLGSSAKY